MVGRCCVVRVFGGAVAVSPSRARRQPHCRIVLKRPPVRRLTSIKSTGPAGTQQGATRATMATAAAPAEKAGAVINLLQSVKLPGIKQQDGVSDATVGSTTAAAAATLQEVAGILAGMTRDHLGALLVHPGHATVGVYYLAKRHQMERLADHIDGSMVGDKELVEKLIRFVNISDSVYPDRYPILVQQQQVVKETDIVYSYKQVHKLQPGFYLALDRAAKQVLWVVRGTHDLHDLLTDLCGVATPLPAPYPEGSAAHWGMWRATSWLLEQHWPRVLGLLQANAGYSLEIVGHSMGAGVGALLALRLNTEGAFKQQLGDAQVTCMGIATAACLSSELASAVAPYVTTLVMRYDLVPRFSAGQMDALKEELLAVDYKALVHEGLLEHEIYRTAVQRTSSVASKVAGSKLGQKAASAAAAGMASLQAKAAVASGTVAKHIDAALAASEAQDGAKPGGLPGAVLQHDKVKQAAGWASHTLKEAAHEAAAAPPQEAGLQQAAQQQAAGAAAAPAASESFDDEGEAAEAAAAAASGGIVDVTLYAPGRLLYVKPVDEAVEEDEQHFQLVDGKADQRFKRIVLRSSCLTDHLPVAYLKGLNDVLASVSRVDAASKAAATNAAAAAVSGA